MSRKAADRGPCRVDGCNRLAWARQLCNMHYARWREHGDPGVAELLRSPNGTHRSIDTDGYVTVYAPDHPLARTNGRVLEHRMVVFDAGAQLGIDDIVHHINGDKADNRLENLEVHTRPTHAVEHMAERGYVDNQYGRWPLRNRAA